jgi:hypothetical protein
MPARNHYFVPRVEALERRWCPSLAVRVDGAILSLSPGNPESDDTLLIRDDGAGNVVLDSVDMQIPVSPYAVDSFSATGIGQIVVRAGPDDDYVDFRLTGKLTSSLDLEIDLGDADNNIANLDFTAGIAAPLTMNVFGGAGNADIIESFGDVSAGVTAHTFLGSGDSSLLANFGGTLSGGSFLFEADGGPGNDRMSFQGNGLTIANGTTLDLRFYEGVGPNVVSIDYQGVLDGSLSLLNNGAVGGDRVDANLTLADGSKGGSLNAPLNGWSGHDEGTLEVVNSTTAEAVNFTSPNHMTLSPGQTASYTASATGSPMRAVTWQVSTNGGAFKTLAGVTSNTLKFTDPPIRSTARHLMISTQPAAVTIAAGQMATFTAAISGSVAHIVQWQVSTDGGKTFRNLAGVTSPVLRFTATGGENGYLYRAVFRNRYSAVVSDAAMLTVDP